MSAWKQDKAFIALAEAMWADELNAAQSYSPVKGKTAASKNMALRYEGFNALPTLLVTAERVNAALNGMSLTAYQSIVRKALASKLLEKTR